MPPQRHNRHEAFGVAALLAIGGAFFAFEGSAFALFLFAVAFGVGLYAIRIPPGSSS
jgi:hypothetical protein